MSDRLVPLLRVYGEDLPGDAAALPGGGAASAEEALLRSTKAALDAVGRPAPPQAALDVVLAAAREAAGASDLATLRSVIAGEVPATASVEYALLRTTWDAVARAPRPAPPGDVVKSILGAALEAAATSELAALRAVLAGSAVDDRLAAEAALIGTTLQALESLPRPTPPPDVVAALVVAAGHAARTSALAPVRSALDGTPARAGAEDALMRTTWQAVERLPRSAPPVGAVQAVLAAAHAAVPSPLREAAALRRAADRPAARENRSFRRFAYLTVAMAFVGFVGIGLWASGGGRQESAEPLAAIDESDPSTTTDAPVAPTESAVPNQGASPAPAAAFADALGSTNRESEGLARGSAAANEFRPAPAAPPSPAPPPPPTGAFAQERSGADATGRLATRAEAARTRADQGAAVGLAAASPDRDDSPGAGLAGTPALAPAWEAGTDVRLLSLRLQTLQQQSAGVAWDEPPAPLGAAEAGAIVPQGFNAVGARSTPARFQVRVGPPGSD